MATPPAETDNLIAEVRALRAEIETFNNHRFVRVQNKPWRLFFNRFLMGLAMGFGTVFGATVLVSVVIYSLQGIDWLPIIGDWASEIATQMKGEMGQNAQP
ncbi:MAG: hypothetical protein GQ535_07675 [Rhodobacteraceae bacterium]|nr:hypothetical protein [Paracoccaceae bacterium]